MRYKIEIIGDLTYITNDPLEILGLLLNHLEANEDKQILICIGDHKEPEE